MVYRLDLVVLMGIAWRSGLHGINTQSIDDRDVDQGMSFCLRYQESRLVYTGIINRKEDY
jgi:hypothetical protein